MFVWYTKNFEAIFRILLYASVMLVYSFFMGFQSPGGFGWHDYHAHRIFNSIEYLKLNGYFTDFGFSIWTSCQDCDLSWSIWKDKIYLSQPALFQLWPYITVNHLFGRDAFFLLGPVIDRLVIFLNAVIVAEFFVRFTYRAEADELLYPIRRSRNVSLPAWWLGLMVFTLYVSSIWSYQMQRAMWNEIWFLLIFSFSLLALLREKFLLGCLLVFVAGLMHYLLGFILAVVFLSFSIVSVVYRESSVFVSFMAPALQEYRRFLLYCLCASLPSLLYFAVRFLYGTSTGQDGIGSTLLSRIGISGDDIHNGGIVGALQFLGGVRVTQCLTMLGNQGLQGANLLSRIAAFNCSLSILGMFLVSSFSVLGVIWLLRTKPAMRPLLFPVSITLLVTVALLQQAFSAHLLGHSYPFAPLFACGLVGLCLKGSEVMQSQALSLIVFTPLVIACVLLSIRVSMISGVLSP
jgi:hypothetical protein